MQSKIAKQNVLRILFFLYNLGYMSRVHCTLLLPVLTILVYCRKGQKRAGFIIITVDWYHPYAWALHI